MTDYPQHIVAASDKMLPESGCVFTREAVQNLLCLALTMTPPEPPKDVLEEVLKPLYHEWNNDCWPGTVVLSKRLRAELARLGHEVALIRQPVSDEVIEREAEAIWGKAQNAETVWAEDLATAISRGIELAGGK